MSLRAVPDTPLPALQGLRVVATPLSDACPTAKTLIAHDEARHP